MEIQDLSWNTNLTKRFNHELLPRSIRGLLIGKSSSGKTTLLLNLLLRPGWLDYDKLFVFGKSLFQPEYIILKKAFEEHIPKRAILSLFNNKEEVLRSNIAPHTIVEEMAKAQREFSNIECSFYENSDDVPDPRELNSADKNLMVFDDLILEKQNKCEAYYVRGRHSNVDCFYLSQNYFKLPRQTIRENANILFLFRQDQKNIDHIYNDHVCTDMSKDEFKNLCKKAWERPHGFVLIDLTSSKNNGKFRSGFDNFYFPK